MDPLLPSFRRQLRARAHSLHPVVSIGHHGLTDSVLHEIDVALTAHELIKVRVFNDDRRQRESMLGRITHALDCAPIQQIGKLLVLWRPHPTSQPEDASRREGLRRDSAGHAPGARRRRRGVAAQGRASTGELRAKSTGNPRTTSTGTTRATPVGKSRATPVGKARATPVGKARATSTGKTRARTPGPASPPEARARPNPGPAPAGVPRAGSRRRRREP